MGLKLGAHCVIFINGSIVTNCNVLS
jgi:hypothetical protein